TVRTTKLLCGGMSPKSQPACRLLKAAGMLRSIWTCLLILAACADHPYDIDPVASCGRATQVLAGCGHALEQSPFGTCQPDQVAAAEQLLDIYDTGGCAALADQKADSSTCSALPFMCVQHTVAELAPFTTDGCTTFPDGTLTDATLWQHCCIEHDFAYYV